MEQILRIKLTQRKASYSREETVNNRMTYPFPPYSTIIGALHNACGYTSYHPMDISLQGKYGAMQKEMYVNHALLNSTLDDRGILIWLKNANSLHAGYIAIAEALANGSSFENDKLIRVLNEDLHEMYKKLKLIGRQFDEEKKTIIKTKDKDWKAKKKELKKKLNSFDKKSDEAKALKKEIDDGDASIKSLKADFDERRKQEYEEPYSHFRTLTKGPQTQEVLYDLEWVIHVRADKAVLDDIINHKNDLISLGRSEDFIELQEITLVNLFAEVLEDEEIRLKPGYTMLVDADLANDDSYARFTVSKEKNADGTVYYVSKDYVVENGKRRFNRIPCLYSSSYYIDDESEDINHDGEYIVNLN